MVESLNPTCPLNYQRVVNRGKAAARNLGIKAAQGEIIFLTDADMIADVRLLEEHLRAHEKLLWVSYEGITINLDGKPYIKSRIKAGQKLKWAYFLTGNLSIRKRNLIDAGLFDENFSVYGWEDLELGYRLKEMGIPLYYLPAAINFHEHPFSQVNRLQRKFEMGRSAARFYKKHPNREIALFLGINPIAMGIYRLLKAHPNCLKHLPWPYLQEEFRYRQGFEQGQND